MWTTESRASQQGEAFRAAEPWCMPGHVDLGGMKCRL